MIGWIITIVAGIAAGWYLKGKLSKNKKKEEDEE